MESASLRYETHIVKLVVFGGFDLFFDILGNLTLQKLYWEETPYWFQPLFSIEFYGDHQACFDSDSLLPFPLDISMANWHARILFRRMVIVKISLPRAMFGLLPHNILRVSLWK